MNPIKELNTIVHAFENNKLLSATEDGHFQEVGMLGRLWRAIKGAVTNEDTFSDCKADHVALQIKRYLKENKEVINPSDKLRDKVKIILRKFDHIKDKWSLVPNNQDGKIIKNKTVHNIISYVQSIEDTFKIYGR